jgi:hypothetical protein
MPRVVPEEVVKLIRQLFPEVISGVPFDLTKQKAEATRALLTLVDQIPHELLPSQANEYHALIISLCTLQTALDRWRDRDLFTVRDTPGGYSKNPVQLLYETLQECPNEAPAPETTDLPFITDPEFRAALRLDIGNAYQALTNREWKAATVLAGSVVEAILLWVLQQEPAADLQQAITFAMTKGTLNQQPSGQLDRWGLAQFIAVAEQLQKIHADAATQAHLAKDFRNLIHPGKAQREAQACTRGTAMAALAAVEMVIECLTP